MIDIELERLIAVRDVPTLKNLPFRRQGKRLHISTVRRWAQNGIRGKRLETVRIGAQLCTSIEALNRFFKVHSTDLAEPCIPNHQLACRKEVEDELDQLGI